MNSKELVEALNRHLDQEMLTTLSIEHVNYNPHPYVIGPWHVVHASDRFGGRLDDRAIHDAERAGVKCGAPRCNLSYDQHTSDKVAFLQLRRHLTNLEATEQLNIIKPILEAEHVDSITFVDTPEKYRIAPPMPEQLAQSEEKLNEKTET